MEIDEYKINKKMNNILKILAFLCLIITVLYLLYDQLDLVSYTL